MPTVNGSSPEYRHKVWYAKTRMVWLPNGEKMRIRLLVLIEVANVTDGHRMMASAALMHSITRQKWQMK